MNNYKNLFLRQSYLDSYSEYELSLTKNSYPLWDYIVLTASNKTQAEAFNDQIEYRLSISKLPKATNYVVIPDPDGKRVGSGGATLNVLRYIAEKTGKNDFKGMRILVIHSGGDSKRIPQYSACGKLFSPVPHMLPDGRCSTLFDEIVIGLTGVPVRMDNGMVVVSGDVLMLFNPLQIDFYSKGAAALSIKEDVAFGEHHGVFVKDKNGNVGKFLHKQPESQLRNSGAVNNNGKVDIDSGAVIFDSSILNELYDLVNTPEKFNYFVNDEVRLSFYADFLYPLASDSTLELFYNETPEGSYSENLLQCRLAIWNKLHKFNMKLISFSPSSFIHFGTTRELLSLFTSNIESYKFLDWDANINSNNTIKNIATINSSISKNVIISAGSYIEDSIVSDGTVIGKNCIISGLVLKNKSIPDNTVLHGLKQNDTTFVVRMYDVNDNPKESKWFGKEIDQPLWNAPLFKPCSTMEEAIQSTLSNKIPENGISLMDSFNNADVKAILSWQIKLRDTVTIQKLIDDINNRIPIDDVLNTNKTPITEHIINSLQEIANSADFSCKIRIFYYLSRLCIYEKKDLFETTCFNIICNEILQNAIANIKYSDNKIIKKEHVTVKLPVRVNWGGGWSDTPPYCNENGGTVLNAAITLNGQLPIEVTIKKLEKNKIVFTSEDNGSYGEFYDIKDIHDCRNPHDPFALHKAALIACGIIPLNTDTNLNDLLSVLGGGILLSTKVVNIPRGSGLGTSSILAGACVKAIYDFFGLKISENDLYNRVICMEQIMSTGGGWQDQVGGLTKGIKLISTNAGITQHIKSENINLTNETLSELNSRFCLIYTGQRRLARNLLREVIGKYIGSNKHAIDVLSKIQRIAVLMRFELEKGNIDGFAKLLNKHWNLSQQLDNGCTNTCINQIFNSIEDLICGKMICGAGGGGFLQVILKKDVTKAMLITRLLSVFADSGVDVWDCQFDI